MKIYNTLTNTMEEFAPLHEKKVNMYVCGPTVNKRAHIGNLYPAIFFDMMYRYLKYLGYEVKYVSNFTDIDDKIIKEAIEHNVTEKEISEKYMDIYLNDLKKLNCLDIYARPKVTEYISEIIDFINGLLQKGYAYKNGSDIYFNIDKVKNYGDLSNQVIEDLDYGKRIKVDENKHNPYDFVLWKNTENGIKWNAPFGEGRPGWHTECVVMIEKIFGEEIDIHGGGTDLKFPHHENEMAQSNAMWGHNLSKYWMHNGHINFNGEKMSKSLGNFLSLDDLLKKCNINSIRITFLKNNYRLPLNLNETIFEESKTIDLKILNVLKLTNIFMKVNNITEENINKDEKLEQYLNEDMNSSNLITYLLELVKSLNLEIKNNNINNISLLTGKIKLINSILGLKYNLPEISKEDVELYNQWNNFRNNKDYQNADKLRDKLIEKEII